MKKSILLFVMMLIASSVNAQTDTSDVFDKDYEYIIDFSNDEDILMMEKFNLYDMVTYVREYQNQNSPYIIAYIDFSNIKNPKKSLVSMKPKYELDVNVLIDALEYMTKGMSDFQLEYGYDKPLFGGKFICDRRDTYNKKDLESVYHKVENYSIQATARLYVMYNIMLSKCMDVKDKYKIRVISNVPFDVNFKYRKIWTFTGKKNGAIKAKKYWAEMKKKKRQEKKVKMEEKQHKAKAKALYNRLHLRG